MLGLSNLRALGDDADSEGQPTDSSGGGLCIAGGDLGSYCAGSAAAGGGGSGAGGQQGSASGITGSAGNATQGSAGTGGGTTSWSLCGYFPTLCTMGFLVLLGIGFVAYEVVKSES